MVRYVPHKSDNIRFNWDPEDNINAFFDGMYHNPFADWMTDGDWNETKYQQFNLLYATPLRYYMDAVLDHRSAEEYLDRYGMDYTDIHDPRKLTGTSSTATFVSSGYRMVSRNIEKLYR